MCPHVSMCPHTPVCLYVFFHSGVRFFSIPFSFVLFVWKLNKKNMYEYKSWYLYFVQKYKYQRLRWCVTGDPNLHMLAVNPYAQMAQEQPTMSGLATHVTHLDLGAEVKS